VNAGPSRRGRRYRAARKRRTRTAALTGLSAAIAVTLLLALGARAVITRTDCTDRPLLVHVVAADEIGPVVRDLGQYFNRTRPQVSGHCVHVAVTAEPPGTVAAQLAGKAPHGPPADAWIPDSGPWAGLAGRTADGAGRVRLSGITLARTALVIAMPRSAAARSPAFGTAVSWKFLLPQNAGGPASALGLHVEFPDPASSITGLVALTELQRLCGRGEAARTALARFAVHVQIEPAPGGTPPLAALATWVPPPGTGAVTAAPVTITTEQAVVQFDRAHPGQPLAVRYPAEGSQELSYPYVLTTTDPLRQAAAGRFGELLRSAYAASYARYEGFRSGNGVAGDWPAMFGLTRSGPHVLAAPSPAQAATALRAWERLSLGVRALTLIDTSAAMTARARPDGPDLARLLARGAGGGLALFPDGTQMGLWTFPSHIVDGLSYQQLVPIGPIADPLGPLTRRQLIQRLAQSRLRPVPGTQAALYSTILSAYQLMLATYQPRRINVVLVLTADVSHDRSDISAASLVRDLQVLRDPRRPVRIVAIMLGRAGGLRALRRIAAATNGQAVAITHYSQLGQVMFQTVARALCQPSCASRAAS
jgi:Bacterial extracellular solute-binding protein